MLRGVLSLFAMGMARAQLSSTTARSADFLHVPKESFSADDILGTNHDFKARTGDAGGVNEMHRRLHELLNERGSHADIGAWDRDLTGLRTRVMDMFYHSYDNYMLHAFPHDELLPLSCHYVDNFGGYALTLVDSLDMLAILGNRTEFTRAVGLLKERLTFDSDVCISVFETNIRVMGGLLSAHLLASDSTLALMPSYDGCLLQLALDLGDRLLPAFDTPTGIPYGTVNMRNGVQKDETSISSAACAGTLLLEFGTLSRLSGQPVYERVAKRSLLALWARRSEMGLVGGHIDIKTGEWTHKDSGVGTSVDSYFEYLIKGHLMTGEYEYLIMFQQAYGAAKAYLSRHPWYVDVNMDTTNLVWPVYNSLQSFWPALEVMAGNLRDATDTHEAYFGVWRKYGFTPEGFNLAEGRVNQGQTSYPLRPELIESTLYLWQATSDPHYIEVGRDMLASLESTRVPCGHAAVGNVEAHTLIDRMDSYFLSETLKYLYLLFSPGHWVTNGSFVFTTEGHPLPIWSATPPSKYLPAEAEDLGGGEPRHDTLDTSFQSLRNSPNPYYKGTDTHTDTVVDKGGGRGARQAPLSDEEVETVLRHVEKEYSALSLDELQGVARKYHLDPDTPALLQAIMQHLKSASAVSHDELPADSSQEGGGGASDEGEEDVEGAEKEGWGGGHDRILYLDGNATTALDQLMRARRLQVHTCGRVYLNSRPKTRISEPCTLHFRIYKLVRIHLYIYIYICISMCPYVYRCMSLHLQRYVCYTCVAIYLPTYVSICLPLYVSAAPALRIRIHMDVYT